MAVSRNKPFANPAGTLLTSLRKSLSEELPAGAIVTVGLSGGLDSVVLLDALSKLLPASQLNVVHVHHGLSKHADDWAVFCEAFSAERNVECQVHRATITVCGEGVEAAARQARYAAFALLGSNIMALAHHADDQAETVLFRLLRGTGIHGLAGMPRLRQQRPENGGQYVWRPFLEYSKANLRAYAEAQGLQWIVDDSNGDQSFTRNFLRHSAIPLLASRFSAVKVALQRVAEHAEEAGALLDERAEEDFRFARASNDGTVLWVSKLQELSAARLCNLVRYWLRLAGWPAPEAHTLLEWQGQLQRPVTSSVSILSYPAGECRLWRGRLYRIGKRQTEPMPSWQLPVLSASEFMQCDSLELPGGVVSWGSELSVPASVFSLAVSKTKFLLALQHGECLRFISRDQRGGEWFQIAVNRPHRTLKKHFQESGYPPWERNQFPLIYVGNTLVACVGVGVAAEWQPQSENDRCITFIWHPANGVPDTFRDL